MKITPYRIKKGLRYLKHYGFKEFFIRLGERMEKEEVPYETWYQAHKITVEEAEKQRKLQAEWQNRPLFSLCVPLYRTPGEYLKQMIASVQAQTYDNWQLCLADGTEDDAVEKLVKPYAEKDTRICYRHLSENKGIAENTNAAFFMAEGEWIGLLDHDDCLAENTLFEVLNAVQEAGGGEVVYTDEDKMDEKGEHHFQPHFKPNYNVDLLRSNNYITHFFSVKREIVNQVEGFRREYDGAQDYDFILRCIRASERVLHVPKILYHWRISPNSTADNPASKQYAFEAGQRAVSNYLKELGVEAVVSRTRDFGFYRVQYPVQGSPLVSVLIPNKDEAETLKRCLASVKKSTYRNMEIIIIENNSTDPETFAYYEELFQQKYEASGMLTGSLTGGADFSCRLKLVTYQGSFNYSAINNFGTSFAEGDYYILLNNDIEILTPDWIEEMLGNCQRPEVGIVGARLQYPDKTLQHAGIVVGLGGIAGNLFVGMKAERTGYLHKASIQLDYSAVTAACMMVKKDCYRLAGGMTEELAVAFNDVDFCLKAGEAGFLVVYNPAVEAVHYESKTRGKEDTYEKMKRFDGEIAYMKERWQEILKKGDPCYNPNLSLTNSNYALANR
jgi:glycosyltransferase involved in cell wall biosynthesis